MTEDPRISEIRAVLDEDDGTGWSSKLPRIRAILDRPAPAPTLGPEHAYALSVARTAVLKAAKKFVTAGDMYRRRDLVRSAEEMADSERACVRVASFLAEEIARARGEQRATS